MRGLTKHTFIVGFLTAAFAQAADLGKVNGRVITDDDLRMAMRNLNDTQFKNILANPATKTEAIHGLIDQELLAQLAEKEGLEKSPEFQKVLAATRRQMLSNFVLEKKLGSKLGESALRKHYEETKSRYTTDAVHVQHILSETKAQAEEIMKKAKDPNADFQKLAEQFSKDPSAKNNRGDLGFVTRDQFVESFSNAAFNAKSGDVVGPVQTAYGYHVIKVLDRRVGSQLNFEEVELRVRASLQQRLAYDFVSGLRTAAKVELKK